MENNEMIFTILALVGGGALGGTLAGLLGIGGGLVLVPILYSIFISFGLDPVTALASSTATSLSIIVPTSISSLSAHYRRKNIDFDLLKAWAVWIILGVFCASLLISYVRGVWLQIFFSLFIGTLGFKMFFSIPFNFLPKLKTGHQGTASIPFAIGLSSALTGIGGGALTVPTLVAKQIEMKRAIGTSAAVGFIISFPGAIALLFAPTEGVVSAPYSIGLVNYAAFIIVTPLSVLFAPLGAKLSHQIPAFYLKKIFALVLISTGIRIGLQIG